MRYIFWEQMRAFYEGGVFIYGTTLLLSYALLALLSFYGINHFIRKETHIDYNKLTGSPFTPGISVIAPAFNEGVTIIQNVRSLMTLNYSRYEVIIINDGSTDNTLEQLITEFEMEEVEFAYNEKIKTQPVKRLFKSRNTAFDKLLVIDKVNGKSKADASNAGVNAAAYDYFLCTDVDCILEKDTLSRMIYPFLAEREDKPTRIDRAGIFDENSHPADERRKVIASGAALRIANSSDVDEGVIVRMRPPRKLLPRFQELEYIRAYVLGKMGWSMINCVPNVSGGLGMFDKEVAIKAGGYDPLSFGEDMDLIVRMCAYMRDNKQQYVIRYIPSTQCSTEGPPNLKIFSRQRSRWGRGTIQIQTLHRKILMNPRYGRLGMVVLPYNFLFEFMAPVIEILGFLYYIYIVVTHQINLPYAILLIIFVYFYSVMISMTAVFWDQIVHRNYKTWGEVFGLSLMAFLEPFLYHPLILFFALRGYFFFVTGRKHTWGNMQRQGFGQKKTASN